MTLRTPTTIFIALLALAVPRTRAQESAFSANHQAMAMLPGEVSNMAIVDGDLYCYASQVLLRAQRSGEMLVGFWADTLFARQELEPDYVVQHPVSGDLYFTLPDKKGRSFLYQYIRQEGRKPKVRKLKMNGMQIHHPTFTTDGRIMIFASDDRRRSHGGFDLWYSMFEKGRWTKPVNLGSRINSAADETSPSIYRDCLIFSSNGRSEDNGRFSIYSTRLVSDKVSGDTVGMFQIGRCRVQRLPYPINVDDADDTEFTFDSLGGSGYWVSNRTDSDSQLYSFSGSLDGVLLWGRVLNKFEATLPGVSVTALQSGQPVCTATTDNDGVYQLYLQAGQFYELSFHRDGFFTTTEVVNTTKEDDEFLIAENQLDAVLDQLPSDQELYYDDLFGPNADIELSSYGRMQLQPLVQYLLDNPETHITLTLSCDLTNDAAFNQLLTHHRLQTLETYLLTQLPPSVTTVFNNGCASGCDNASRRSRLVAIIQKNTN